MYIRNNIISLLTYLFIKPYMIIGIGSQPLNDDKFYLTSKIGILNYGVKNIGMNLLSIGLMTGDNNDIIYSPISIYGNNISVSFDCNNQFSGLSIGYKF